MKCELLKVRTRDQQLLHGGLFAANESGQGSPARNLLLFISGVGSNFYQPSLLHKMVPALNQAGVSVLSVNTRGHDFLYDSGSSTGIRWAGSAMEIVDECRLDISAWVRMAVDLGYDRIGLMGHSLGAIKSIYSQAVEPNPALDCLIALSPSCLSSSVFSGSQRAADYQRCLAWAKEETAAGRGLKVGEVDFPFQMMMSPRTFLDKYGEEERYNILHLVEKIETRMLITLGEREVRSSNPAFENLDRQLEKIVSSERETGKSSIELEVLPDADHHYSGTQLELARLVIEWFGRP